MSLLESIATKTLQMDVFRLASPRQDVDFLRAEAFDVLTSSARRPDGTNLPVFRRHDGSNPVVHALVAMTLDPSSGEVAVSETDVESS